VSNRRRIQTNQLVSKGEIAPFNTSDLSFSASLLNIFLPLTSITSEWSESIAFQSFAAKSQSIKFQKSKKGEAHQDQDRTRRPSKGAASHEPL